MLYLIATPIGNLQDITLRALELLKSCDYILCEDTRHSLTLLRHYEIHKPLKSYHKFNESSAILPILEDLKSGLTLCLISDAGSPGISDPGSFLVTSCIEANIPISVIPGACAIIPALSGSGLSTEKFQFLGFLPRKANELKHYFIELLNYNGTSVCYESPQRILATLTLIQELDSERSLVIARELTKKFEEFIRGTAKDLIKHFEDSNPKGEIVLMIAGRISEATTDEWKKWTPEEHVDWMIQTYGISKQEAIKLAAKLRGVPKRELYKCFIDTSDN